MPQKRGHNRFTKKPMPGTEARKSTEAEGREGPARSVQKVLALVDTADPAFSFTAAVLKEFAKAGRELDETAVAEAVELGRERWRRGRL